MFICQTLYCVYHFIYLHNMLKSHARVLLNPDYFYKSILRKPGWDTDRGTCPRNSLPHFCRLIFFVVSFKWRDQVSTRESCKSRKLSNFVHSQCFFPTEIGNCGQVLILVYSSARKMQENRRKVFKYSEISITGTPSGQGEVNRGVPL